MYESYRRMIEKRKIRDNALTEFNKKEHLRKIQIITDYLNEGKTELEIMDIMFNKGFGHFETKELIKESKEIRDIYIED